MRQTSRKNQQVITVFKHGPKPRKMIRILVAPQQPFDQVISDVANQLQMSTPGLLTMSGNEVQSTLDILHVPNNIVIAAGPGEFDLGIYQRKTQLKPVCKKFNSPYLTTPHTSSPNPPPFHLAPVSTPRQFTKVQKYAEGQRQCNMLYRVTAKGAYQRVPPQRAPPQRVPPMSKSSATRLPPIGGGWDSSDGRSSGSDIHQRRVGYERQMKREYNARHNNRMNRMKEETGMEQVSDILMSRDRQMRAEHQIRLERRQKMAQNIQTRHIEDEFRLHQNRKVEPRTKQQPDHIRPKKLVEGNNKALRKLPGQHQDVVNLFTKNAGQQKMPVSSFNKHSVLPSVRQKVDTPPMQYMPKKPLPDPRRKRKKEVPAQIIEPIPAQAAIPAISQPRKPRIKPEVIARPSGSRKAERVPPVQPKTPSIASSRHSTPPHSAHSSQHHEKEKTNASSVQSSSVIAHRVHTPIMKAKPPVSKVNYDDLGYDSPKDQSKHSISNDYEIPEEEIVVPAKLTQRDSGLADSIEPDSTESRRQSITPIPGYVTPETEGAEQSDDERSPSKVPKLDPVTEETETESPPLAEIIKFKPMLEVFHPKTETQLNQTFVLGPQLGDGNFAVVKTALNKVSKENVALKVIDKDKLKGKEAMMINEIQIMRKLDHNHCVKLYDVYENEAHIFLVMELVQDGDLFDVIVKHRCFNEATVRGMMYDMVSALHYMHSNKIVHRDIKPENILVNKKGGKMELKLADFGLSMVVNEPIYTICGTPTYIAPEILVECGYGLEIDMWAIGVINYILLCGFPPFRSKNKDQEELFTMIMSGEYKFISPYWDKISTGAKDLINKLLVVVPDDRYTAQKTLNHSWLALRED